MPTVEDFLTDARDAAAVYKQKLQDAQADIEQDGNGLSALIEARTAVVNYIGYLEAAKDMLEESLESPCSGTYNPSIPSCADTFIELLEATQDIRCFVNGIRSNNVNDLLTPNDFPDPDDRPCLVWRGSINNGTPVKFLSRNNITIDDDWRIEAAKGTLLLMIRYGAVRLSDEFMIDLANDERTIGDLTSSEIGNLTVEDINQVDLVRLVNWTNQEEHNSVIDSEAVRYLNDFAFFRLYVGLETIAQWMSAFSVTLWELVTSDFGSIEMRSETFLNKALAMQITDSRFNLPAPPNPEVGNSPYNVTGDDACGPDCVGPINFDTTATRTFGGAEFGNSNLATFYRGFSVIPERLPDPTIGQTACAEIPLYRYRFRTGGVDNGLFVMSADQQEIANYLKDQAKAGTIFDAVNDIIDTVRAFKGC